MISEGIVTTLSEDGTVSISPMGPEVDASLERLVLKPYTSSTTYRNLKRSGQGVFHVTDDVELVARAAIGAPLEVPMTAAAAVEGRILSDACRWYAFRVLSLDDSQQRTRIECQVVEQGRLREFFGFNRGKHAVIEAAILATRVQFLAEEEILAQFERLEPLVQKTGGPAEHRAFALLQDYIHASRGASAPRVAPDNWA